MSKQPWDGWYKLARWQRRRKAQLMAEPLCAFCLADKRITAATVADHLEPHRGDPDRFWHGPLQSLCKAHHDATKQRTERRGYSTACGVDGWPIDPRHPANAPK